MLTKHALEDGARMPSKARRLRFGKRFPDRFCCLSL
jgi:hypothetical protein